MSPDRQTEIERTTASGASAEDVTTTTGVFLINLGTPDAPQTREVRRYLKQFLSDPRVLDISPLGRYLLLRLIILPFRPAKSAEAYRAIWTDKGSPILEYGRQLTSLVQDRLNVQTGGGFDVRLGMRYGNPSIPSVLRSFQEDGIDNIVVMPLYPQYASSTTGSSLDEVFRSARDLWNVPNLRVVPPFYNNESFVNAWKKVAEENFDASRYDHILFSFHGLPERHVRKSDMTKGQHCLSSDDCCSKITEVNRFCYRAHCLHTARSIANSIDLPDDRWTMTFQSRLGRDPWLKPYTDHVITGLAEKGVKRLAIFSPAFVADCLETLEELGIRAVEDFKAAGGEECHMVPSLNVHPAWVDTIASLVLENK